MEEVAAGRVLGPLPEECVPASGWHVSHFGVIPKPHKPNKWRLIVDLLYPAGASVNDSISPALLLPTGRRGCGGGTAAGEGDGARIKAAYRIVPVRPDDRHLLAMRWQGGIYVGSEACGRRTGVVYERCRRRILMALFRRLHDNPPSSHGRVQVECGHFPPRLQTAGRSTG